MSDLTNRQLRALALTKRNDGMNRAHWSEYGFSKAFLDGLAAQGYLKLQGGMYVLSAKGRQALEESR